MSIKNDSNLLRIKIAPQVLQLIRPHKTAISIGLLVIISTCSAGATFTVGSFWFYFFVSAALLSVAPLAALQILVKSASDGTVKSQVSLRREAILANCIQRGETSIDVILKSSQFHEQTLLQTLKSMVDRGLIDEELDVDSGVWTYKLSSQYYLEQTTQGLDSDLESRLKILNERKDVS